MKRFSAKVNYKGLKKHVKILAHKARQKTGDSHSWGLPNGASPMKRMLKYQDGYRY